MGIWSRLFQPFRSCRSLWIGTTYSDTPFSHVFFLSGLYLKTYKGPKNGHTIYMCNPSYIVKIKFVRFYIFNILLKINTYQQSNNSLMKKLQSGENLRHFNVDRICFVVLVAGNSGVSETISRVALTNFLPTIAK